MVAIVAIVIAVGFLAFHPTVPRAHAKKGDGDVGCL
jgi:hypothetical protein